MCSGDVYADVPTELGYRRGMAKTTVAAMALMLTAAAAHADGAEAFDEKNVCRPERSNATVYVVPPLDEVAISAKVEADCRHLSSAKKSLKASEACQRWRNEAAASIEHNRAARKSAIALRDANAKKLAECVDRERRAHDERAVARKAEEDTRKADEERKIAEATAKRERIEALLSSKPTVRLALSAMICVSKTERTAALRAIADEKKYARIGGVQNMSKIYDLQMEVRAADRHAAWLGGEMKKRKVTAIKCGDSTVKQIAACIRGAADDARCLVDEIAGPLLVVGQVELE